MTRLKIIRIWRFDGRRRIRALGRGGRWWHVVRNAERPSRGRRRDGWGRRVVGGIPLSVGGDESDLDSGSFFADSDEEHLVRCWHPVGILE